MYVIIIHKIKKKKNKKKYEKKKRQKKWFGKNKNYCMYVIIIHKIRNQKTKNKLVYVVNIQPEDLHEIIKKPTKKIMYTVNNSRWRFTNKK